MKVYEVIVCILIAVVIGLTLRPEKEEVVPIPKVENFDEHPLTAWKDGKFVKIKYIVDEPNRRLWIYNNDTGELIHKQPYDRDPSDDGTPRTFTYLWKTYKTERTIDLLPGTYQIILGGEYEGGYGQLSILYNHI